MSLRVGIVAYRSLLPETVRAVLRLERAVAPVWHIESGANVDHGRNRIARALKEDVLLFVDADMNFTVDDVGLVLGALDTNPKRGAVSGCCVRWKDGVPVHNWQGEKGWLPDKELVDRSRELRGVHSVDRFGAAFLAVSKEALGALDYPYFESGYVGEDFVSEDVRFCQKLKAAGFDPSVHFGAQIEHIGPTAWKLRN